MTCVVELELELELELEVPGTERHLISAAECLEPR